MRLPGTRYQEHGWEQVRKLLGHCSLQALAGCDLRQLREPERAAALLDDYTDAVAAALCRAGRGAHGESAGNSYGESVCELALSLVYELQALPSYWTGFAAAVVKEYEKIGPFWETSEGSLRKKINDMFVGLRDKVDADSYQVSTGRDCSPNKMYTYRMLDTAYHGLAALFANWRQHEQQVAAILGRAAGGMPIEARQMRSIAGCKAEWVIRWSETLERFGAGPGPLHTKSKRFSSLRNNPATIAAMLAEIGDYEQLSSNQDRLDDWRGDAGEAALWLDDYWRVVHQSELAQSDAFDLILPAPDADADEVDVEEVEEVGEADEQERAWTGSGNDSVTAQQAAREQAAATAVSLPPRFMALARAAQDGGSWALRVLKDDTLAIRLAVCQKILGADDDSYPDPWRDPATGALPTLQQLAALDGISMPTLRKRRNDAIARLRAASRGTGSDPV